MDEQSHMGKFSKIRWAGIPTQSESSMVATGTWRTNWRWAFVFNQAEAAREASPAVTA